MSSEILSALIAQLSVSKNDDDRNEGKARIEDRCLVSDSKINHLLKLNQMNFSNVVEYSGNAIHTIAVSKARCLALKERLMSCMEILQCRRDNIRVLWTESLQHKYIHQILEEIESLRKIPETVKTSLEDKKFLNAAEVLAFAVNRLEGDLSNIDALKDLKSELYGLEDKLYTKLLEELVQGLYASPSWALFQGFRDGNLKDITYEEIFNYRPSRKESKIISVTFDVQYVKNVLKSIYLLKRLPEAVDALKERCQPELIRLVEMSSKFMYDTLEKSCDQPILELPQNQQQLFLVDLLETILHLLRQISLNYMVFLNALEKIIVLTEDMSYQLEDIYSKIQTTVEHFVTYYMQFQPLATLSGQNSAFFSNSRNVCDVTSFFLPKSQTESNYSTLFKFQNSAYEMNKKQHSADERKRQTQVSNNVASKSDFGKSGNLVLICKPALKNITVVFNPLKRFVSEIEVFLHLEAGSHCLLHSFLYDCANHFLEQVNGEVNRMLENASLNLEAWNVSLASNNSISPTSSEKQILSSTVIVDNNLKELQELIANLPDYANHLLHLIHYVALDYKDLAHKAFKSLFEDEHCVLSISWAKDRDIRRLLKSFSNWKHFENRSPSEIVESPEDIRLRNKEESELLIRNLNSEEESSWEIISDYSKLMNIALLLESLQWFSVELGNFVRNVTIDHLDPVTSPDPVRGSVKTQNIVDGLNKLAKEYEEFSDVCLLSLHLEIRAHCFHYLLPYVRRDGCPEYTSNFTHCLESAVQSLTADFLKIDETLHPVLSPRKLKYIFEGLGEMISSILIHNVSNLSRINEKVIRKIDRSIFIIQSCLCSITLTREVSLERARHYVDLLNLTCGEILNQIVEGGPRYSEYEYASVFKLLSANEEDSSANVVNDYLNKLQHIFERGSTTV